MTGYSVTDTVERWLAKQPHHGSENWATRHTIRHLDTKRRELAELAAVVVGAEKVVAHLLDEGDLDGVRQVMAHIAERAARVRQETP